jgi:hypothetical protein
MRTFELKFMSSEAAASLRVLVMVLIWDCTMMMVGLFDINRIL